MTVFLASRPLPELDKKKYNETKPSTRTKPICIALFWQTFQINLTAKKSHNFHYLLTFEIIIIFTLNNSNMFDRASMYPQATRYIVK